MNGLLKSANEPEATREAMLTPLSINEPPVPPERPPEIEPPAKAVHAADPDEMEEEIEAAEDEGDFRPTHRDTHPHKRGKAKR